MSYDPKKTLELCDAADFKTYLEWRVKWSRIKKLSTIHTYWKVHSMLYAGEVCSKMKDEVLFDIRNVGSSSSNCSPVSNILVVAGYGLGKGFRARCFSEGEGLFICRRPYGVYPLELGARHASLYPRTLSPPDAISLVVWRFHDHATWRTCRSPL
jgi:hypothetical protein